jgi:CBS domain-containing protein
MKAVDIMDVPGPSVSPQTAVLEAVQLMLDRKVSALPVIDSSNVLVGMITEGDLLRRSELGTARKRSGFSAVQAGTTKLAEEFVRAHAQRIGDVMTRPPVSVSEETSITEVVDLIEKRHLHHLLVVKDGRLVGVIGRPDLLRALIRRAEPTNNRPRDDDTIRNALLAVYGREAWAPLSKVDVVVREGIVELRGHLADEMKRRALIVAAEAIAGVKSVKDLLSPKVKKSKRP